MSQVQFQLPAIGTFILLRGSIVNVDAHPSHCLLSTYHTLVHLSISFVSVLGCYPFVEHWIELSVSCPSLCFVPKFYDHGPQNAVYVDIRAAFLLVFTIHSLYVYAFRFIEIISRITL